MTNLVLSLLLLTAGCVDSRRNKVLLVSMDGFRWDYVKSIPTPNLDRLAGLGTRADYVNNTFCTKTFPSHFSVATGKSCFRSMVSVHDTSFIHPTVERPWWKIHGDTPCPACSTVCVICEYTQLLGALIWPRAPCGRCENEPQAKYS